eukprot:PLAT3600.2.p1 GENE.PLAT3600.2~~PLAT3600.2.p1  ORF type:complete len:671 (+),score=291.54 PLAT3600.2:47-2014(+)
MEVAAARFRCPNCASAFAPTVCSACKLGNCCAATQRCQRAIPFVDIDFAPLFRSVQPSDVVQLLTALMLERSVAVTGSDVASVSAVCETLRCLLYPLQWPHVYIPVLPLILSHVFQAPVPFLVGAGFPVPARLVPDDVLLLNLDSGSLRVPDSLPRLPARHSLHLYRNILRYADLYREAKPEAELRLPPLPEGEGAVTEELARTIAADGVTRASWLKLCHTGAEHSLETLKALGDSDSDSDDEEADSPVAPAPLTSSASTSSLSMSAASSTLTLSLSSGSLSAVSLAAVDGEAFHHRRTLSSSSLPFDDADLDSLQGSTPRRASSGTALQVAQLRRGVLSVLLSLLKSYRLHIIHDDRHAAADGGDAEDAGEGKAAEDADRARRSEGFASVFDVEGFVASHPPAAQSFAELLSSTAMFHSFLYHQLAEQDAYFEHLAHQRMQAKALRMRRLFKTPAVGLLHLSRGGGMWWSERYFQLNGMELRWYRSERALKHLADKLAAARSKAERKRARQHLADLKKRTKSSSFLLKEGSTRVTIPQVVSPRFPTAWAFEVITDDGTLRLCAQTSESRSAWIRAINSRVVGQVMIARMLESYVAPEDFKRVLPEVEMTKEQTMKFMMRLIVESRTLSEDGVLPGFAASDVRGRSGSTTVADVL